MSKYECTFDIELFISASAESHSLEIFKTCLDAVLCNLF